MHIIPIDISISASQHDFKFDNGFVMNVYCAADASRVLCPLDRDSIGRTARFNNSHHGYRGVVNQQHTHTIFISYFSHHNYLIWITIRAQNFARPICSGLPHLFYLRLDIMCLTEIGAIFDESAYIYIYREGIFTIRNIIAHCHHYHPLASLYVCWRNRNIHYNSDESVNCASFN